MIPVRAFIFVYLIPLMKCMYPCLYYGKMQILLKAQHKVHILYGCTGGSLTKIINSCHNQCRSPGVIAKDEDLRFVGVVAGSNIHCPVIQNGVIRIGHDGYEFFSLIEFTE